VRTLRNKTRLAMGEEFAKLFHDYSDDLNPESPRSIHYKFVKAHRAVLAFKRGQIDVQAVHHDLQSLNDVFSNVLDALTTEFLRRAEALEPLNGPSRTSNKRRKPSSTPLTC
jgi:hypothetical protein